MSDLTITCLTCKQEFVFTQGEQDFYRSKNLPSPTLCMICRARQKAEIRDKSRFQKNRQ
jgi:hypothetical protein